MTWAEGQAIEAVRGAKEIWGKGWAKLSDEQREGAIAIQIVNVLTAQHKPTDPVKELQDFANITWRKLQES